MQHVIKYGFCSVQVFSFKITVRESPCYLKVLVKPKNRLEN